MKLDVLASTKTCSTRSTAIDEVETAAVAQVATVFNSILSLIRIVENNNICWSSSKQFKDLTERFDIRENTKMEISRVFDDLESNQHYECEESKKKLLEWFSQNKDQWLVHGMMDYFLKTGSLRIMEVLVKVQSPHDNFIFDRLDDLLKSPQHRNHALNIFCFVVRHHPTWLCKIEKHRFIKSVFKLLMQEKEIIPLMGALLGIITLLPIIPNSVTNFLNELFEVFGHLASWKLQNTNKLPDDKLIHLQLGLQMLFHRLYGMYPCNFLAYLSDFIKKDKGGGIFQHTIKPLLETVRVHPMLLTATTETEIVNLRWKEMEPHDVVMECANLSLPVVHTDYNNESIASVRPITPISTYSQSINHFYTPSTSGSNNYKYQVKDLLHARGPISRFDVGEANPTIIWSPLNEISTAGSIPLTPTAPYTLTGQSISTQLLSVTGSSPPEAAVEATPETTPMKDFRELKMPSATGIANSNAVRAILMTSQPSSPMRKDRNQYFFSDVNAADDILTSCSTTTARPSLTDHEVSPFFDNTITTTYDRRLKQVIQDRVEIEAISGKRDELRSPNYTCTTPEIDVEHKREYAFVKVPQAIPSTMVPTTTCGECNETDRNMCSAGGLHMPTSRSMHQLVKGVKRRNRMVSYCEKVDSSVSKRSGQATSDNEEFSVRRTKSCSALLIIAKQSSDEDSVKSQKNGGITFELKPIPKCGGGRLQKSGKMLAIPKAKDQVVDVATQTNEALPEHYENALFEILYESKEQRNNYARNILYPQDLLDQYIIRSVQGRESFDMQSQIQLLWLQLEYERYRRGIHSERNRRLMGRSRDKRSLEMERDRLREQLKKFDARNKSLMEEVDKTLKQSKKNAQTYKDEIADLKLKLQLEVDQKKSLQQANEELEARLNEELVHRKEVNYELESLRGQIFSLNTELDHVQQQADTGLQCKQELERLEAEFIVMGEVQVRCRDRLSEVNNYRARDEELQMLQESYNTELKELRHSLEDKTGQLDSSKHKVVELQAQLVNCEKVITEQKRLLKTVKDEYDEMFRALSKKYEVQKNINLQLEERIVMTQQKPPVPVGQSTCSPDTDKTDIASSMERNSPLSTSLASSESLSASLRSSELKNLQQLVETPPIPEVSIIANNFGDNRMTSIDLASPASHAIDVIQPSGQLQLLDLPSTSTSTSHPQHPHAHLQQHQHERHDQQQI